MYSAENESGVSVIVGTLLLILITVVAAAGLALMISQMQKDEMNRQAHLAAVKSENVGITNIVFENNDTLWDETYNIKNSRNWSSISFSVRNDNIYPAKIISIGLYDRKLQNYRYVQNYSTESFAPNPEIRSYNFSNGDFLTIPERKSIRIKINLTGDFPHRRAGFFAVDDYSKILLITSMYNNFEKIVKEPVPIIETSIESDTLGPIQRDALILDGSKSVSDGQIIQWNWTIFDGTFTSPVAGNWSDIQNWTIHNQTFSGKTVRIDSLNNTRHYHVALTVIDDKGVISSSNPIEIPWAQYRPPTYLSLNLGQSKPKPGTNFTETELNATVLDIRGNPVQNSIVTFIITEDMNKPTNCFSLTKYAAYTDRFGNASTIIQQGTDTSPSCPMPVIIKAQVEKIQSPGIIVEGIP